MQFKAETTIFKESSRKQSKEAENIRKQEAENQKRSSKSFFGPMVSKLMRENSDLMRMKKAKNS